MNSMGVETFNSIFRDRPWTTVGYAMVFHGITHGMSHGWLRGVPPWQIIWSYTTHMPYQGEFDGYPMARTMEYLSVVATWAYHGDFHGWPLGICHG